MKTAYYTFGGTILAQEDVASGTWKNYGPDALGSVIGTYEAGALPVTGSFRYSPYGSIINQQAPQTLPDFTWVGTLGYRPGPGNDYYVRARDLSSPLASWTTVDPLWPGQSAYSYARAQPASRTDPDGRGGAGQWGLGALACIPPCNPSPSACDQTCQLYWQKDQASSKSLLYPKGDAGGWVTCCNTTPCPCVAPGLQGLGYADVTVLVKCFNVKSYCSGCSFAKYYP